MIRDGIETVAHQGAPHETLWPYTLAKFRTKPSKQAFSDAKKHAAMLYLLDPNLCDDFWTIKLVQ